MEGHHFCAGGLSLLKSGRCPWDFFVGCDVTSTKGSMLWQIPFYMFLHIHLYMSWWRHGSFRRTHGPAGACIEAPGADKQLGPSVVPKTVYTFDWFHMLSCGFGDVITWSKTVQRFRWSFFWCFDSETWCVGSTKSETMFKNWSTWNAQNKQVIVE